jgi:glycosyltransferase involved in cell wall biosynthesis
MLPPIISICIPTYEMGGKGLEFLKQGIESIRNQTLDNYEIIISDNSKVDDIENYCNEVKKNLNLFYVRNLKKVGISPNLNFAISHARGDIIKILFQDDFLYDNFALQNLYEAWKIANSKWLVSVSQHTKDGENYYLKIKPKYNPKIFLGANTISSPSVLMVSRHEAPLFDENLTWLMDCDYYKNCFSKFGSPGLCEQITIINRVGLHQASHSKVTRRMKLRELKYVMNKYKEDVSLLDYFKASKHIFPNWFYKLKQNLFNSRINCNVVSYGSKNK